jgi:hypothetical protein
MQQLFLLSILFFFLYASTTIRGAEKRRNTAQIPSWDSVDTPEWNSNNRVRDVCVLGSGASGMSAAVFLKDKYYDVLVLEKESVIGGHCDTDYFTPPTPGQPGYIDLGVQVFTDTAFDNASGFGQWNLSSRAFAQRFLPADGILPNILPLSTQSNIYLADFLHGIFLGPQPPPTPPTPDFIAAFDTLFGIVASYPWLETADFPDPIPSALLIPFDQFIFINNLTALSSVFYGSLYIGGMGNFSELTTLYALQNLRRGILLLNTVQAAGFRINNGCRAIYNGMTTYLGGQQNVVVNANVLTVDRPAGPSNRPTRLLVQINNSYTLVKCRKLIVSFPQLLSNLQFMDLRQPEIDLFSQVQVRNYYDVKVNISGPITMQPSAEPWWTLGNIDVNPPGSLSPFPTVMGMKRDLNYGPGAGYAFDDGNLSTADMTTIIQQTLARINFAGILNVSFVDTDHHQFQAHFTLSSLAQSPTPYTRFDALQGQTHTYWTGALRSFAETSNIWQKTYNLINQYF